MKVQIRRGVFETNSSSTHSLQVCSEEQFQKWKNGQILFDYYEGKFIEDNTDNISKKVLEDYYDEISGEFWKNFKDLSDLELKEIKNKYLEENYNEDARTYEEYGDNYETFEKHYTTEHGDQIVIFGYYGYD